MQRSEELTFGSGFCTDWCGCHSLSLALQSANLLSLSFQSTYRSTAKFDNVGGLKPKAAVRSAGVVVGRVESIAFDDKTFQARVSMALERRYAVSQRQFLENFDQWPAGRAVLGH
jgi:phospholipid/cholesterol/gamma-HCH transport system substrate-binding protein